MNVENQYNLEFKNIDFHTPQDTLVGDAMIGVTNCCDVTFKDVWIDGTYSKTDYYGYGICMGNVSNAKFIRLKGNANWGVFGNNNVNTAYLKDCDINRFDVTYPDRRPHRPDRREQTAHPHLGRLPS